jgi:hypothetical protein
MRTVRVAHPDRAAAIPKGEPPRLVYEAMRDNGTIDGGADDARPRKRKGTGAVGYKGGLRSSERAKVGTMNAQGPTPHPPPRTPPQPPPDPDAPPPMT